jgi:hypothetical protein
MRRRGTTRWLPMTLLLLATGCGRGEWVRVETTPQKIPAYEEFQVWSSGTVVLWRAVVISADSVSGREGRRPRRSLPRAEVDSIRLAHGVYSGWDALGLFALAFATLVSCAAWCR